MELHKPPFILREIKIEVTQKCPLRCVHCSSLGSPESLIEMSPEICFRIIDEAGDMEVKEMAFSGGEPLLWGSLLPAIERATAFGIKTSVYTSGNHADASTIIFGLKNAGCEKVIFSLYAASEAIHESITGIPGSFNKTLESIGIANLNDLNPELHFVPFGRNYRELESVAELARKLNIAKISVLRFVPQGRGKAVKEESLNRKQYIELRDTILTLRNKGYSIRTGSPFNILQLNDQPKCCAAIDRITIGPNYAISPCDAFKRIKAEDLVGEDEFSYLINHSLDECWNRSKYLTKIREYLTSDFEEPCKSCNKLNLCLSGCLAQKVIEFGDLEKHADPWCLRYGSS